MGGVHRPPAVELVVDPIMFDPVMTETTLGQKAAGRSNQRVIPGVAIPRPSKEGWLPPGEHLCTLPEIESAFAGAQSSAKRQQIFAALVAYLSEPIVIQYGEHAFIDGSFISVIPEPRDVDVLLGMTPGTVDGLMRKKWLVHPTTTFSRLQGLYSEMVGGQRAVHALVGDIGGKKYEEFRSYFQRSDRATEPRVKGILRVELT